MRISVSSCFFEQAANAASEKSITAAVIIATIRFIKFFFMSFFITFSPFHSFQRYYQSKIYSHSLRIFSVSLCNSALNNAAAALNADCARCYTLPAQSTKRHAPFCGAKRNVDTAAALHTCIIGLFLRRVNRSFRNINFRMLPAREMHQ